MSSVFEREGPASARPYSPEDLGTWCIRRNFATREQIDKCLRFQREETLAGRIPPKLGEILVSQSLLTPAQVASALADQGQEIRQCPRCGIRVNVPLRPDAAGYRCGQCDGPLVPVNDGKLSSGDDPFMIVSRDPLPADVAEALERPDTRFGKYILVRELGKGGVGVVSLAWDTFLCQYIALKRIRPDSPDESRETRGTRVMSLIQEARNAIRLRHPGIVTVYDVGRVEGQFYVSMEYLEGETLASRILQAHRRKKVPLYFEEPTRAVQMLAEVARSIHFAHTRPSPVIHCDLKPANIIVDHEGYPHVLDLGLARSMHTPSEEGEISGTPGYMAPEQARGEIREVDARADIYALGSILYELLTGRHPFVGKPLDVLRNTISQPPFPPGTALQAAIEGGAVVPPGQSTLAIPRTLEELCLQCLDKDRLKRPESMLEFARRLDEWRHGQALPGGGSRSREEVPHV